MAQAAMAQQPPTIVRDPDRGIQYQLIWYEGELPEVFQGIVFAPWVKQIRRCAPFDRKPKKLKAYKHDVLEPLVRRCGIVFAANPTATERVYGWACGELLAPNLEQVLHFAYVRNTWRKLGIGTRLIGAVLPALGRRPISYTHQTRAMRGYLARKWDGTYKPELAKP